MIELKTASYKGVEFLFEEAETTGGNRNIGFTFPGSDAQSVERQGGVPRTFKFLIIIPHDNYYTARDDLIRVFEDGKKGTLVHPTFGSIDDVVSGQYTLTEKITELGRGSIDVELTVDNAPGIPVESDASISQVEDSADDLIEAEESEIEGAFEISAENPSNFADALAIGESIVSAFEEAGKIATAAADKLAEHQAAINAFAGRIGDLVRAPADLASTISGIFESTANLYDTAAATLGAMRSLLSFGSNDPVILETTSTRIERKKNRDVIRTYMRAQAIAYAYLAASQVEYKTEDELNRTLDDIENAYIDLRENQLISDNSLELLDRLRVKFYALVDSAQITPRKLVTITTERIPLSVLLYQYYGHTNYFDEISDLNNINQNAFVEGDIMVFAE